MRPPIVDHRANASALAGPRAVDIFRMTHPGGIVGSPSTVQYREGDATRNAITFLDQVHERYRSAGYVVTWASPSVTVVEDRQGQLVAFTITRAPDTPRLSRAGAKELAERAVHQAAVERREAAARSSYAAMSRPRNAGPPGGVMRAS